LLCPENVSWNNVNVNVHLYSSQSLSVSNALTAQSIVQVRTFSKHAVSGRCSIRGPMIITKQSPRLCRHREWVTTTWS